MTFTLTVLQEVCEAGQLIGVTETSHADAQSCCSLKTHKGHCWWICHRELT